SYRSRFHSSITGDGLFGNRRRRGLLGKPALLSEATTIRLSQVREIALSVPPVVQGSRRFAVSERESKMKQALQSSALLALFLLLVVSGVTSAQTRERGAVHGTVLDNSKAAIAGAKVTLVSPSTGLRRELSTNGNGFYDFEAVTPGTYSVVVEATGFATKT